MTAPAREVRRLVRAGRDKVRRDGVLSAVSEAWEVVYAYAAFPVVAENRRPSSFAFRGRQLTYQRHPYNRAWLNERSVELALAFDFLERHPGRVLEVGNVLVHYGRTGHVVVDKYERYPGIVNEDIIDFRPSERFDVVVSISTLEHVGWDEHPRRPERLDLAVARVHELVRTGGSLLATCPLGYNRHLDERVRHDVLGFPAHGFLRRIDGRRNLWTEVGADDVSGLRYGGRYRNADALFVGLVEGQGRSIEA